MIQAVRNAFRVPDLRRRFIFTIGILIVFRLAAHIPVPGVDREGLRQIFEANQLLGLLNMLSGGAMANFSVVALGVYPYITASIVISLLQPLIPRLEELVEQGEAGRNKIEQYTYLLTIPLAALQAFSQATLLQRGGVLANFGLSGATLLPTIATIATLTAGTIFAIWLGELITEQGIGNGLSILIFGGIVADVPESLGQLLVSEPRGLVLFVILTAVTVAAIVAVEEGQRRIPVQYGKRVRGTRMYAGQSTHIPLRVNSAGMMPIIFAQSIMLFPGMVSSYFTDAANPWVARLANGVYGLFDSTSAIYWLLYFLMVIGFTYFYTDMVFQQQKLAETLQRQGGFIPGIRPGKRTAGYLNGILQRLTLVGAVFLGVIAILPFLETVANLQAMLITSTGLLIVVGVVLDTMKQLEAQLLIRHYEGFIR